MFLSDRSTLLKKTGQVASALFHILDKKELLFLPIIWIKFEVQCGGRRGRLPKTKEIETLLNENLQQGDHTLQLNTIHLSKEVYLVKMIRDDGMQNQKLIAQ